MKRSASAPSGKPLVGPGLPQGAAREENNRAPRRKAGADGGDGPLAAEPSIDAAVRDILVALGEDPRREGLRSTPARVAKALRELTSGYAKDIDALINAALFDVEYSEMVMVKDIQFASLCEHHMLPFFGTATVAYVPDKKIVGLSKIPKVVSVFARRLQVQERMTEQIARTLVEKLKPLGVGVIVEARHLCMEIRGAMSPQSPTVTSAMHGCFQKDPRTRREFLALAGR